MRRSKLAVFSDTVVVWLFVAALMGGFVVIILWEARAIWRALQ